jgi:hypothetical protein
MNSNINLTPSTKVFFAMKTTNDWKFPKFSFHHPLIMSHIYSKLPTALYFSIDNFLVKMNNFQNFFFPFPVSFLFPRSRNIGLIVTYSKFFRGTEWPFCLFKYFLAIKVSKFILRFNTVNSFREIACPFDFFFIKDLAYESENFKARKRVQHKFAHSTRITIKAKSMVLKSLHL